MEDSIIIVKTQIVSSAIMPGHTVERTLLFWASELHNHLSIILFHVTILFYCVQC